MMWVVKRADGLYLDEMGGPMPPGSPKAVRWVASREDATRYRERGAAWADTLQHGGRVVTVRQRGDAPKLVTRTMPFTKGDESAAEEWLHENCPDICREDFYAVAESLAAAFAARRSSPT